MDATALTLGALGLMTTLSAALGASWLGARSQSSLARLEDRRVILDQAAVALAASEQEARQAFRALLDIYVTDDAGFDQLLRGEDYDFPQELRPENQAAVHRLVTRTEELRAVGSRLAVRLGQGAPAVTAFEAARSDLSSVATTLVFAAEGTIGPGGSDLDDTVKEFYRSIEHGKSFLDEARRLGN